ncbi:MAG: hypothetical protein AB7F76_12045 [Parvibaculaceae bacterium]|jgi:hypothetical protein
MPNEEWARRADGKIELSPVVDWDTGVEAKSVAAILRIWFQVGEKHSEDVQLQLSPIQVKGLRAALERLEKELVENRLAE